MKNIKIVLAFILGLVISGIGVYALSINSKDISYNNTNVSDALDYLYENSGGGKVKEYIMFRCFSSNNRAFIQSYFFPNNAASATFYNNYATSDGYTATYNYYTAFDFKYLDLSLVGTSYVFKAKKNGTYEVWGSNSSVSTSQNYEEGDTIITTACTTSTALNGFDGMPIMILAK